VNHDGKMDLISHYWIEETEIASGDTRACLSGTTLDGASIDGCDVINTLPACGLGFELVFVLPPLMWWRAKRRRG
jgi:hypothetical protein